MQLSQEADAKLLINKNNRRWACNISGLYLMPLSSSDGRPYDLAMPNDVQPPGKVVSREHMLVFGSMLSEMIEKGMFLEPARVPTPSA